MTWLLTQSIKASSVTPFSAAIISAKNKNELSENSVAGALGVCLIKFPLALSYSLAEGSERPVIISDTCTGNHGAAEYRSDERERRSVQQSRSHQHTDRPACRRFALLQTSLAGIGIPVKFHTDF